ncbi:hypothetical protein [Alkalihalobacterium sp. APHAB7]|uniref:hypothetical protein n=1 Tax=Alkalihalobacterium sp. APHAB7 TaxID=3402081 RepID=UPI003AAC3045
MTQYIYIASPMRLKAGSFGSKPVSVERPHIFHNEWDFTHLFFENNYDANTKKRFSYSTHFSFKHQVACDHNHMPLKTQITRRSVETKCLTILYDYMEEALEASGILEYFTSLNGHEDRPLYKKRTIRWANIQTPYDLVLEDREFWEVTY